MKKTYLTPDIFCYSIAKDDVLTFSEGGLAGEIGEENDGVGYFE